jgi:H+/Cl- antiporter ClcA
MDKEDIDKNLELVLYILLGILGGFYGLVVAEFQHLQLVIKDGKII